MGDTKRQHFVPQLYLRRFADADGNLWVYDKRERRRLDEPLNVKVAAQSSNFYDFPTKVHEELVSRIGRDESPLANHEALVAKAEDQKLIEHHLRDLEGHFAAALRALIDVIDNKGHLDLARRQMVAYFLLVQRMRTPAFRARLMQDLRAATTRDTVIVAGEPRTFSLPTVDETLERVVHAHAFTSPNVLQPEIEQLIGDVWHIGLNRTSHQLYTSDDPVIVPDVLGDRATSFSMKGIRLLFPLTPEHLLVIFKQEARPESTPMSLSLFMLTDELVAAANRLQVINCTRQVYCRDDQFELAEVVAKELRGC